MLVERELAVRMSSCCPLLAGLISLAGTGPKRYLVRISLLRVYTSEGEAKTSEGERSAPRDSVYTCHVDSESPSKLSSSD